MPESTDIAAIQPKWDDKKNMFFIELIRILEISNSLNALDLEIEFKELAAANQLKPGDLMLPFRIMLVGGKFGPGVFEIASIIGKEATINRMKTVLTDLK